MANTILIKKSSTANAVPQTSDLAFGELAINIVDGNLFYKNSATGNVTVIASNKFSSVSGNVVGGNVLTAGQVSATGNVTGNYILGNISQATGYNSNTIYNGTSNVSIATANGNVTISVGATPNVAVFSTAGISLPGNVVTGNLLTDNIYYANGTPWDMQQPAGSNTQIQFNNNGNFGASASLAFDSATNIFSTANITASGTASVTGNITGGNVNTAGLVNAANVLVSSLGNQQIPISYNGLLVGGVDLVWQFANARLYTTGLDSNGAITTSGTISATGNVTGGNLLTSGAVSATGNGTFGNISTSGSGGNITGANVIASTTLSATANVVGGNIVTVGLVSASGNVSGNYFIGNGSQLTGVTATSVDANNLTGNTLAAGVVNSSLTSVGTLTSLSVSGNTISGNLATGGEVSATGNVTGGNVNTNNLVGTGLTVTSTGNLNLQPTGNVVLANAYINGVAYPAQDQDAASKIYVDNMVSTGLAFHPSVYVATTDTLANITGGTITYAQPNGVANGVGATLTTTGSFNLIDTANVQTVGTRILVKNQANAVQNGVYVWSNATVITRSSDTDEYGPNSDEQLSLNDYFFVTGGNVNLGSSYVVSGPTGTITFGTSNIDFSQFSQTQVYSANVNAGLSLVGQTFNAKVDNNTTAFDGGGNIVVKPSANLTTPNIGAATGTSLSLTGTATVGNVATGGTVSATGNITGGNISVGTATITTFANITATTASTSNITGALRVAGGVGVTGNVYADGMYVGGDSVLTTTSTVDGGTF